MLARAENWRTTPEKLAVAKTISVNVKSNIFTRPPTLPVHTGNSGKENTLVVDNMSNYRFPSKAMTTFSIMELSNKNCAAVKRENVAVKQENEHRSRKHVIV